MSALLLDTHVWLWYAAGARVHTFRFQENDGNPA